MLNVILYEAQVLNLKENNCPEIEDFLKKKKTCFIPSFKGKKKNI